MATNFIVTGHTGEAHITSDDMRTFQSATLGSGEYVLATGEQFEVTIIDNHTVNLASGDLLMQGVHARIPYNTVTTLYFENGVSGYNRKDLIIARYENSGDRESVEFAILQGESSSGTAVAPTPTKSNLLEDGNLNEMPLYEVTFEGTAITSIIPLYTSYETRRLTTTLQASKWVGTEYSFESEYPSDLFDLRIQMISSASADAKDQFSEAIILPKADMTNVLVATSGVKPTVDIPVSIRVEVRK